VLRLTRQKGQGIYVNGPATITIQEVKGKSVGLGIDAPVSTNVRRCELGDKYEHIPPVSEELLNACKEAHTALAHFGMYSGIPTRMFDSAFENLTNAIKKATVQS